MYFIGTLQVVQFGILTITTIFIECDYDDNVHVIFSTDIYSFQMIENG